MDSMCRKVHTLLMTAALPLALVALLAGCTASPVSTTEPASEQAERQETAEAVTESSAADEATTSQAEPDFASPGEGYTLKKVVALARHNIRAPLSNSGSVLALATPHDWIAWSADPSCLTTRGGVLETLHGQFMRRWLEAEHLIPEDWQPQEGQVRVYANSLQRTHASAQYFIAGMLPVGDVPVETHLALNERDLTFIPVLNFMSDSYREAALAQIAEEGGTDGVIGDDEKLKDAIAALVEVCDYTESEGYKSGELTDLDPSDVEVVLELGEEPALKGSLKTANSLADALVLQSYEAPKGLEAFGKSLTDEQWGFIDTIKEAYDDTLFSTPLIVTNVAHPMLAEIASELDEPDRLFSFLCGHDSDLSSVMAALGVEDYELAEAIERKTPVGSMLLFETWEDAQGTQFGRLRLLYQTPEQLRNPNLLLMGATPASQELRLEGLVPNDDGLYAYTDLRGRLQESLDAYDELIATYDAQEKLAAAA